MRNMKLLVALASIVGLGACTTAPEAPSRTLLDETGTVVSSIPASEARDMPPGTAFRLNLNGRDQTVTLGPRVSEGTSAGTAVLGQLDRDGAPRVTHAGPGVGNLAPGGTPYVARIDNGRPIIGYRTNAAPDASGRAPLETTP